MSRFSKIYWPGPTDLTWEERNPSSYITDTTKIIAALDSAGKAGKLALKKFEKDQKKRKKKRGY